LEGTRKGEKIKEIEGHDNSKHSNLGMTWNNSLSDPSERAVGQFSIRREQHQRIMSNAFKFLSKKSALQ